MNQISAARKPAFLAYGQPLIEEDDVAAVAEALRSGWLTTGPAVPRFETALAERVAARYAISCANGTAALHLAAMTLGLGPKSTVIVPAITFVATANAARYVGAKVIFADVDAASGLMTPETLATALDRAGHADAVFPVHLAGQTCDMAAIHAMSLEHGFAIVEDACHALGTTYDDANRRDLAVGACLHSDLTVFSFHPVKTIAMGEGGAITTRSNEFAHRLARLRSHGLEREPGGFSSGALAFDEFGQPNPWYYELRELGFNYRASDIHCALGLSQLRKLARFKAERAALVELYDAQLERLSPHIRAPVHVRSCNPAWHLYAPRIDFSALGVTRGDFMRRLGAQGIGSQVHYMPLPYHPYYRAFELEDPAKTYPGAAAYYDKTLSLPLYVGLHESDIARVMQALRSAVQ